MTNLEKRKKEVELARVRTARMELELKVDEKAEEIQKLKEHIEIQIKKENDLMKEIEK